MSTTVDKISGDLHMTPELRKSFNLLKTHASKVANFTLQWQDLEEHFRCIDNSIQSKLDQLQKQQSEEAHLTPAPQSQPKEPELNFKPNSEEPQLGSGDAQLSSKESQVTATLQSLKTQFDSVETQVKTDEPSPEMSTCNGVPINDGKALLLYANEHLKEKGSVRDGIVNAIKASVDAGKLVLEAVKWFYPSESNNGGKELDFTVTRKSCAILLQGLVNVKPVIKPEIIGEAMKLALAWKAKVITQMSNSLEVWVFFQLLDAFGLGGEFDSDEILKLFSCVADRNSAPELFRSLGFADKASDFIQKLVSENKRLDAVRFSRAFGQFDKFPPVPLLKAHLKFSTEDARTSSKSGQDCLKAQDESLDKELAALIGIKRCVEEYKLVVEPEYYPKTLGKHIRQLKRLRKHRKATLREIKHRKATLRAPGPKAQPQPLSGKKRTAPGQPNEQNRNKHPRTAPALAAQTVSPRGPATVRAIQPSYIRQVSLYDSRSAEYLLSSAGMPRQATTPPSTSYGAISTLNPLRASHHQQGGSFIGQGAEYPSRYYDSAHYAPDTINNLSARSYDLVGSSPGTRGQLVNLTARDYGLTGPSHVHTNPELGGSGHVTSDLSPLVARYRTSIPANGRTGQLGSAGSPTPMRIASPNSSIPYAYRDPLRAPNYNDRAVPSSSGYGAPSQHPPAIYHL